MSPSWVRYANQGATRNLPLAPQMYDALSFLPELGVTMEVFSGGQPAKGTSDRRVGSVRHDHGNAADVFFYKDGRRLDWSNPNDLPLFEEIVRRGRASGLTGFGAGDGYMQPGSMHIGFGTEAVWGAGGKGANAPDWLRAAYYGTDAPPRQTVSTNSPQGLLPTMQQEAPQMQREKVGGLLGRLFPNMEADRADEIRLGLQGLLHNPNEAKIGAIQARMGERADNRKTQAAAAQAQQQANRTAQWLAQQPGGQQYAQAIASGALPAGEALTMWRAASQGPEYRQVTGEEAKAMGLDPARVYNVGADGKISGIGGGDTNINFPDPTPAPDATLRTELQKNQADTLTTFANAGAKAASNMGDLQALRELSALAPSGPISGRLAQQFPDFNDVAAVRQSIVKRVAPQLRVEGSGSTSDIEYAGMIEGLGNLANSPEANMAIADMMIAKAEIDLQRANLIAQYQNGQLEYAELNNQLSELNRKSIMPDSLRSIIDSNTGQAPQRLRYNVETGEFE